MGIRTGLSLLCAALLLSACGGMNRAVGVLPNTLDNLERESDAARGDPDRPLVP